ncbi:MAG TPA: cysteine desulfurase [Telmatospirillum sp.]|nr:cysteine desulfurase [Telmatospirillum sp.]
MFIPKTETHAEFDVESVRADFPILARKVRGMPLVYLDSGASAQKPRAVIDAEAHVYETEYANIHRGLYYLSERATETYEASRRTVQRFINARHAHEVIFTRNTTESINLVAASYGRKFLQPGDEIIISGLEHHSNIVPWQLLRDERGVVIKVAPVADDGDVPLDALASLIGPRTKLVSVAHISNVLGTVLPVAEIIRLAHAAGAKVLIDGAQAVSHLPVDVQALDADFYAFSGHKLYGPTGIGVLFGKEDLLNAMPPYQGGGDMIQTVSFEKSTWAALPQKFEAGTPAIAQVSGLAAAIDYVTALGLERIAAHEADLLAYATQQLTAMPGLHIIGTVPHKAAVISFVLDDAHPHDIAQILDNAGVAIRAGHHCAQPLMERFDVPATARASFGLYNNRADVDVLVAALRKVMEMFGQ